MVATAARSPQQHTGDVAMPVPPGPPQVLPPNGQQDEVNRLLSEMRDLQDTVAALRQQGFGQRVEQIPTRDEMRAAIREAMMAEREGHADAAEVSAALNDQAFQNERDSFLAKYHIKSARQRAERPDPIMTIATDSDQMSVHVNAWKVAKYAGAAICLAAFTYGAFLFIKVASTWVAKRIGAGV